MRAALGRFVHSIRFRLVLWFVAILAAVLAAFSVFVYASQASDLHNLAVDRLALKTRQWETYLKYGARQYFDANRPLIPGETRAGEPFLQEEDILALVSLNGQLVQVFGPASPGEVQQLVSLGMEKHNDQNPFSFAVLEAGGERPGEQEYLFVSAPISYERRLIGFFILGTPVDAGSQMRRLLLTLLLGNVATLGAALAGGYWLADRAMRPVKTITRLARDIGATDLSRRLNLNGQDELGELAGTFDGMLARLQAAFDRQRQFTADAGHELRTPLTIVNLEAGRALTARRTAQEYQRALAVIQSENELMTRLVNNLLTLSRMDAGQAAMRFEPVDLSDVALDVVERLAPLAEQRGVALSTGELPELKLAGDRQYLGQMIANLVENAIKYAPAQAGWVRVETGCEAGECAPAGKARPQPAAMGWVRVADNGPGVSPEHLPHLFDRFYQVDRARSRNPEDLDGNGTAEGASAGAGLGLAIVQRIAQAHAGEVSVQSALGQGSVFTVSLPLLGAPVDGDS